MSKAAALGWARGPGKRSERRSRQKAICPNGMRSFWKVAALRLTESIQIQSARRALRCFQNELHHFYHFKSEVVLNSEQPLIYTASLGSNTSRPFGPKSFALTHPARFAYCLPHRGQSNSLSDPPPVVRACRIDRGRN